MELKNYYATAQYFSLNGGSANTLPAFHRYLLLVGFDEETMHLVNEKTLHGREWNLLCGKKEVLDFSRASVSNGRELSELSEYSGQMYKRTPPKKTFKITLQEFREVLFNPAVNRISETEPIGQLV